MVRIAMQRLERPLAACGAFMIIQGHDELVVECPVGAVDAVVALTCEQMTAFDFWLRPRVECERGENYWDMTKIREAIPSPLLSDAVNPSSHRAGAAGGRPWLSAANSGNGPTATSNTESNPRCRDHGRGHGVADCPAHGRVLLGVPGDCATAMADSRLDLRGFWQSYVSCLRRL